MKSMILAINITNYDDIVSNISEVYTRAISCDDVLDVVVFLPKMSNKLGNTVVQICEAIDSSVFFGRSHFFVDEDDKSIIPLDYWKYLKELFPKISVCSKEDAKTIDGVCFQAFSSKSLYSGELDEVIGSLYAKLCNKTVDYCFAVESSEDRDILSNISSRFICLDTGIVKSFNSSKYNSIDDYSFEIGKINNSIEESKNNLLFVYPKEKEIVYAGGPTLKKSSDSNGKKGRR